MTDHSFSVSLVRKSERAIQIARLSLENEDPDSAVNRAYYSMFNISRAALLKAGVPARAATLTSQSATENVSQPPISSSESEPKSRLEFRSI